MLILAFDSTATTAAAALWRDGSVLCEYTVNAGNTHSVTLLPMAEHMLKVSGTALSDVDVFAVSVGPGSFTGVRIGTATVKGLAAASGKPCVGVSTLEALAENLAVCGGYICPVMNARRDQVYTALFRSDGETVERLTEDSALSLNELSEKISVLDDTVHFCGDGYFLAEERGIVGVPTPARLRLQSAVSVAAVAERIWNSTEDKSVFSAASLVPVYLRKPQAEREREERLGNATV